MKQGSADDPFANETPDETAESTPADSPPQSPDTDDTTGGIGDPNPQRSPSRDPNSSDERPSLPYIHARDGVKDGRSQRPVFLRDHIEDGIGELLTQMESELDEDVYKTDLTEAAMAVAQENPELVLEKLSEWGYGL